MAPVSSKDFLDNQTITECRFTLDLYVTWQKHRHRIRMLVWEVSST